MLITGFIQIPSPEHRCGVLFSSKLLGLKQTRQNSLLPEIEWMNTVHQKSEIILKQCRTSLVWPWEIRKTMNKAALVDWVVPNFCDGWCMLPGVVIAYDVTVFESMSKQRKPARK